MPKINPNSELVLQQLLRNANIRPAESFGVGTILPDTDNFVQLNDGFVQILVVGGTSNPDVPTRRPLIQVDCWVGTKTSTKPRWPVANTLAEDIMAFIYDVERSSGVIVPLDKYNMNDAIVQSIVPATEIRRVNGDPAGHARYTFDITLIWVARDNNTV